MSIWTCSSDAAEIIISKVILQCLYTEKNEKPKVPKSMSIDSSFRRSKSLPSLSYRKRSKRFKDSSAKLEDWLAFFNYSSIFGMILKIVDYRYMCRLDLIPHAPWWIFDTNSLQIICIKQNNSNFRHFLCGFNLGPFFLECFLEDSEQIFFGYSNLYHPTHMCKDFRFLQFSLLDTRYFYFFFDTYTNDDP